MTITLNEKATLINIKNGNAEINLKTWIFSDAENKLVTIKNTAPKERNATADRTLPGLGLVEKFIAVGALDLSELFCFTLDFKDVYINRKEMINFMTVIEYLYNKKEREREAKNNPLFEVKAKKGYRLVKHEKDAIINMLMDSRDRWDVILEKKMKPYNKGSRLSYKLNEEKNLLTVVILPADESGETIDREYIVYEKPVLLKDNFHTAESVEPVAETTPEPVAESVEPVAVAEITPESVKPVPVAESTEPVAEIINYGTPARIISGELTTAEKRAVARIMTEKICTVEDAENSYYLGYNNTLEITSKASGETTVKHFTIKIETEKPAAEITAESVEPVAESVEPVAVAEITPESVKPVPVAESTEPVAVAEITAESAEPVAESKAVKARKPRKKKEPAESPVLEYSPCIPTACGVISLESALSFMEGGSVWSDYKKSLEKINYEKGSPIITLSESTGGYYPRETMLNAFETFEKLEKDFSLESGMIWETLKAGKNIYCKKGDSMFNYNDKSCHGTIKSTYIYDSNAKIMTVITWLQATTWKKAKKVETRYNIPSYVGYSDLTVSNQLIA